MRFTVDSNVLIYAVDKADPHKNRVASAILARADLADCILTTQALGEFLKIIRQKHTDSLPLAMEQVDRWSLLLPIIDTTPMHLIEATKLSVRHKLQFWDCVIWRAACSAGATALISEDMQDGLEIDGMTVVDPFNGANLAELETLLTPPPETA